MRETASEIAREQVERRGGWFRPLVLAVLILILLNTLCVGGVVVLLVRQIISIPPGLISALTGGTAPVSIQATTVLDRIQTLSDVVTTRYNYSSLVTSQRDMPGLLSALYGDKELMVAVGHINAGIDMTRITASNITRQGDAMTIQLPPPQLLDCFLDEQSSYVVSRDTGVFAKPAPNLDQEARRYAVSQFRDMAIKADIYSEVQTHAQTVVQDFVTGLGIKQVTVQTTPP